MSGHGCNFTSERARRRIERMLALLKKECLTVEQIADKMHAAKSGTNVYVVHLHKVEKQIHIAGWDTSGYRAVAVFAKGDKPDAPKPPKKSKEQIWREIKADPEKLAKRHMEQANLRDRRREGRPPRAQRHYDPPLEQQVQEFIDAWPGMTAEQIADKLDACHRSTARALTKLHKQGIAVYRRRSRAGALWELASRKVVRHAPVVKARQGIFAALGI